MMNRRVLRLVCVAAVFIVVVVLWRASWSHEDVHRLEEYFNAKAATQVPTAGGAQPASEERQKPVLVPTLNEPPQERIRVPQPPTAPRGTTLQEHNDDNDHHCDPVAGKDRVINAWKQDMRVVCDDPQSGIRIREFVQRSFEYKPQLFLYENVDVEYFNGNLLPNPCPVGTYFEEERSNEVQRWAQGEGARAAYNARNVRVINDRTIIRMRRFDVYNIYEALHGYLNTYLLLQVLDLDQDKVQFAFTDDDCGDSETDAMMWNSMNHGAFPIIYTKNHGQSNYGMVDGVPYRVRMVRASSTGTSMVCSNHPPLRGRSVDHHCKSSAFRAATAWMRNNFGNSIQWSLARPGPKTVVLWSSRRPYQRDFHYKTVPRQLPREDAFIAALQESLGAEFDVRNTDFGSMMPDKSIEAATNADVLVGVHGAGLTWAAFLPRHGGIVEVFAGDRGEGNRHYHNIASLADIHYRSTTFFSMNWTPENVHVISRLIKGIPLHQSAEPR